MQRGPKAGRVKSGRRGGLTGSELYRESDPGAVYEALRDSGVECHTTSASLFAHQYARYWELQEAVEKVGYRIEGPSLDRKSVEVQIQADALAACCKLAGMIGLDRGGALQEPGGAVADVLRLSPKD